MGDAGGAGARRTVGRVGKRVAAAGFAAGTLVGVAAGVGPLLAAESGESEASAIPATTSTSTTVPGAPPPPVVTVERTSADADEPLCVSRIGPPDGADTSAAPAQTTLEGVMGVVNTYGIPLGEEFHGAGMTWTDDGRRVVVAAFVANVAQHRDALEGLVDDPDHLMVCRARLTRSEGAAIVAEVQPQLGEFEHAFGPTGLDGRVEVNVLAGHDEPAEVLHAAYGDQLDITLGAFPYPMPDPLPDPVCPDLPGTNRDLPYAVDEPSPVVIEPADGVHTSVGVPFVNATTQRIAFGSGHPRTVLVDPHTGDVVGVPNANVGIDAVGVPVDLEPGAVFDATIRVPTAACDPSMGHTLRPGDYDLYAVYSVAGDTVGIAEGNLAVGPVPVTLTAATESVPGASWRASLPETGSRGSWTDCPSVHLVDIPAGWDDQPTPTDDGFELDNPLGAVQVILDADHPGPTSGAARHVDGYPAHASVEDDEITVHVLVNRDGCGHVDIAFVGWEETQIDLVLAGIEFGDGRFTDVDAGVRVLDGDGIVSPQIFGRSFGQRVDLDPFVAAVSARYGAPDVDTGWLAMPDEWTCTGAGQYRNVVWGDLLVVFERTDQDERMTGWWVGTDRRVLAPVLVGDDPAASSLGIDTDIGLRLGGPAAVVEGMPGSGLQADGRITLIGGGSHLAIATRDGTVTGFGTGRLDCIDGA